MGLAHPSNLRSASSARACGEIEAAAETTTLTHPEWLALLLHHEVSYRRDKRLLARLRYARLRHQAAIEDVDYHAARSLDRILFQKLAEGAWIDLHENLILCGPTGVGKCSSYSARPAHYRCRLRLRRDDDRPRTTCRQYWLRLGRRCLALAAPCRTPTRSENRTRERQA